MNRLNIRLPEDDQHGPNPYDSRTELKHQFHPWLWDWKWWLGIILFGVTAYLVGKINGRY